MLLSQSILHGRIKQLASALALVVGYHLQDNTKKLTRFEKARVLGARAIQLSMGAKPMKHKEIEKFLKSSKSLDPIDIATKELELGILPLNVRHKE